MATTLGIAVTAHDVALVLVEGRQTGTATLDQVLLNAGVSTTTPSADAYHKVLAEVEQIMAVLDANRRPLLRVAVAAVEPAAAVTAVRLVEALTEAGLVDASLVDLDPSPNSLARQRSGYPNPPAGPIETLTTDAAMTAAHDIAVEELALVPGVSWRALGGVRTRRNLAIAATALATVGVGLIGFRLLPGRAGPEIAPVESTDPGPVQMTQRATRPPTTTSAVNADTITRVPAPVMQPDVPAPSTPTPTSAPTQGSLPNGVEIPPTPQDGTPPQAPQEPEQPPPPSPQPPAEPPAPADPQAIEAPP